MKIDDIIKVYDRSWSMILIKGGLKPSTMQELKGRHFRVLATNGVYPIDKCCLDSTINDTMAVDVNDPDFVLFTREWFCGVAHPSLAPSPPDMVEVPIPRNAKRIVLILP